jgi:glycosyltransferase involved in cell wall biosynthesis
VDAIRRTIRRSSAQDKHTTVAAALRLYLEAKPNDAWAAKKLALSEQMSAAADTNASILRRGFVFPARETLAYEPQRGKSLYLLNNSLPETSNGYATRSHGLLSGMIRSGWDVDAMTRPGFPYDLPNVKGPHHPVSVVVDDVPYHRTSSGRVAKEPIPDYIKLYGNAVVRRAQTERPFVIHGASNYVNGLAAVAAARRLGIPSVYEVRGLWEVTRASRNPGWEDSDRYRLMKRLETDAACAADVVLTITGALKDELVSRGVEESKISIVPNGVDVSRFNPIPRDPELVRQLGLADKVVIGYVGSVLDYEGIGLLVEAAELLGSRRSDFRVLIVGDGAEREQFERLAVARGVRDIVLFTGRVPHHEVERYYSVIDVAPFPRLPLPVCEMVSPLKPFEAMAMGKAVIASDVKALAEIVDDGVTGLLHTKGDALDLARKLELVLDNRGLAFTLGEAGRKWVKAERDWTVISERISEAYLSLGGSPNRDREGAA